MKGHVFSSNGFSISHKNLYDSLKMNFKTKSIIKTADLHDSQQHLEEKKLKYKVIQKL